MTNRNAAMRYARALLEVSQKDADPVRVEQELSGFVTLSAEHPTLASALVNPSVPPSRKHAVMTALLPHLGDVTAVTGRFLLLLAERDRLALLPEILEVYREYLHDLQGIVRARVTTASPLTPDRVASITETLERATGKHVRVTTDVDVALVGGLVTQIGSTVFDGSIAHHLTRLRRRFLSEA